VGLNVLKKEVIKLFEDIQYDATNYKGDSSPLLPRILRLARNLNNKELESWVRNEMNGYPTTGQFKLENSIPDYRMLIGYYSTRFGNALHDTRFQGSHPFSLWHSIAELEGLSQKETSIMYQTIIPPSMGFSLRDDVYFNINPIDIERFLLKFRHVIIEKLLEIEPLIDSMKEEEVIIPEPLSLDLSNFHPTVIKYSEEAVSKGMYRSAIVDTYIALIEEVKKKSNVKNYNTRVDDTPLMQYVFSAENPLLIVSDDKDERLGAMYLFCGAVAGIRNPNVHRVIKADDPQAALEWLSLASALFRLLDQAKQNLSFKK
jgi:uncharacterized protein (TIGR02391 family)